MHLRTPYLRTLHVALATSAMAIALLIGGLLVAAHDLVPRARIVTVDAGLATTPRAAAPVASHAPPGYTLEGFVWPAGAHVSVYSTWDGGACVFGGTDFTGPAAALDPAIVAQTLQASIDEINGALRGGLVLVNVGTATRDELCSKDAQRPIVVGYGHISEVGRTVSLARPVSGGPAAYYLARVFLTDSYDFACPTAPVYRDLQHTITHELLHAIGLGHSTVPTAIMAPSFTACRSNSTLQPDDIAALTALYPPLIEAPGSTVSGSGFVTSPAFSARGQALAVFEGGTVADLEQAAAATGASGVWAQGGDGRYQLLIVGGPSFARAAFDAAFPAGFPGLAAVTLVRDSVSGQQATRAAR